MKKIIFLLLLSTHSLLAERYAVIIGVGDYPAKTGWSSISSANDVPLIKQSLVNQSFREENIFILVNEQATKNGILETFNQLQAKIVPGDIVVIHYSGHGQQIFDDNSDEKDGLDEALVPYDAYVRYSENYKGDNHLRDDQIAGIIADFRNKLGRNGQLLMLLDSSHSGSSTRGGTARGSASAFIPNGWNSAGLDRANSGSDMFETGDIAEDAAPFVLISGASANELNYEYDGKGSLSYSFAKAMNELGSDFTYRQLYSKIASLMNSISPRQTPIIEGNQDDRLFKGEYSKQKPYFPVGEILRSDVVTIPAGIMQRISEGTRVTIVPAGTEEVGEEHVSKGTVTNSKYTESIIRLDQPLMDKNQDYWVFLEKLGYRELDIKVFIKNATDHPAFQNGLSDLLEKKDLGDIVRDPTESDIYIIKNESTYSVMATNGLVDLHQLTISDMPDAIEQIGNKINTYAEGRFLKNLNFKNPEYEFEFKLIPVKYNEETGEVDKLKTKDQNIGNALLKINSEDIMAIQIKNRSEKPLYFTIFEINNNGEINSFFPNDNCYLNDSEKQIPPGETVVFKDCLFTFGPPYEKFMIKGFASPYPEEVEYILRNNQNKNPNRGTSDISRINDSHLYSTEFIYEILESN